MAATIPIWLFPSTGEYLYVEWLQPSPILLFPSTEEYLYGKWLQPSPILLFLTTGDNTICMRNESKHKSPEKENDEEPTPL